MAISRWQQQMRGLVREPSQLLEHTGHAVTGIKTAKSAVKQFPVKVPGSYLRRIEKNNPADPLLRQVLPLPEEDDDVSGFSADPLHESSRHHKPGLIQKYHGRVLLISSAACAIHCRYCFRRHYPYSENLTGRDDWQEALDAIREDNTIKEVILSGGDPLSLNDAKLRVLINKLEQIPHLQWLRIHSRIPVVLPERITSALIATLNQHRFRQILVIHSNHPNEINSEAGRVLNALHDAGIMLLNQSVLLRGINDEALILAELSERLYAHHVLPYYLHMLDPVQGAAHFDVNTTEARQIMHDLRSRLPGYLVPRLVREIAGAPYKKQIDV